MKNISFYGFDKNILTECLDNLSDTLLEYDEHIMNLDIFKFRDCQNEYNLECIVDRLYIFNQLNKVITESSDWKSKYNEQGNGVSYYIYIPNDDSLQGQITLEIVLDD